jgi:hypothetical protein
LAEVIETKGPILVENLVAVMSKVPSGPWSDSPNTALIVLIKSSVHQAGHRLSGGGHQSASAP